jgi:hypothetical protein
MSEIVNKVAQSGLIQMDLERMLPKNSIIHFDLKDFLWQELVLKEKDFRKAIADLNDADYQDKIVRVYCSVDAVIPTWAYMLVTARLSGIAYRVFCCTAEKLHSEIAIDFIQQMDVAPYVDGKIIVKGCANIQLDERVYSSLVQKLQAVAKSLMFGEPCSTVPVFKRK